MRYVMMHKSDRNTEAGVIPSQELIAGMGRLVGDVIQSGIFLAADGLRASKHRVRVTCRGGKTTVTRGPFQTGHDVIAGFMALKVKDIDEAIAWTKRHAEILGDAEFEIGPNTEAWDLGAPKPEGVLPLRCLVLHKATRATESGNPPPPQQKAAVGKLIDEMKQAGVLVFHECLLPTAQGARLQYRSGKRTVTDGPFTESKELIGGFIMLQARSRDEMLAWADRFARVYGDVEIDLRAVAEPSGQGAQAAE